MRTAAAYGAACLAVGSLCCEPRPEPEQHTPASVATSAATIPLDSVSGNILGRPFTVRTARYTLDRRPNYEKLEIQLLAAKPAQACDDVGANHETMVWLRRTGDAVPQAETVRFGPKDKTEWQAHYEVFDDRHWSGTGNASVMLDLAERRRDMKLAGELHACFGDRTKSCVAGSFVAVYCPTRIDALVRGTDSMERPPPRSGRPAEPAANVADEPNADAPPAAAPSRIVRPPPTGKRDIQL